jgi:hypothetical protein
VGLFAAWRALTQRRSAMASGVGFGGLIALSSLAMHSFTDFNLRIPANAALFAFVWACAWLAAFGLADKRVQN